MSYQLVVFDVDGTLTTHKSIWWRLHEVFETTGPGKEYFDQYFRGEIDYDTWADLDADLWKDKSLEQVLRAVQATELVLGAPEVVRTLKKNGIHVAILSGGLDIMADDIASRLGIDYVLTNRLIHKDGLLTGAVESLVGYGEKAVVIRQITEYFDVSLARTVFVGDGMNDIGVFEKVGLSIAFNPEKEEVAKAASVVVREPDLRAILPIILQQGQ